MSDKEVKEETPEVKEITNEEFLNIINIYCPETDINRVNVIASVSMVKHGMDKYWKSVIKQKDQEHEKAKLELIEFAYSERDTIVSLQKEVESITSKLFRKDQEIAELNKIIETYISLVDDAAKDILEKDKEIAELKAEISGLDDNLLLLE